MSFKLDGEVCRKALEKQMFGNASKCSVCTKYDADEALKLN